MERGTGPAIERQVRLVAVGAAVGLAALVAGLAINLSGANDPPAPKLPTFPQLPGKAPGQAPGPVPSVPQLPSNFPTDLPTDMPSNFPTGVPSMPNMPSMPSFPSVPGGAP
ncbi:hypothetical protein [Actinomadura rupiterrae]|uniref:hypothetical protein n=1 Tax=Actinomadura rupiterrae TaxID=559627 RepID=UPI0020A53689|nr:hypothetical protein [Actinomadura rupiterrae]MCP2341323.1 hypothetical protein [Actinomadura rupiterrae]